MAFKYIENKDIQRNFVNGISEVEVLPGNFKGHHHYKLNLQAGATYQPAEKYSDKTVIYIFGMGKGYVCTPKNSYNINELAFFVADLDGGDYDIHAVTDMDIMRLVVDMNDYDKKIYSECHYRLPFFASVSNCPEYVQDCKGPTTHNWMILPGRNVGRVSLGVCRAIGQEGVDEGTIEKGHTGVHQWNYCLGNSDFKLKVQDNDEITCHGGDWSFIPAGQDHSMIPSAPGKELYYVWFEQYTRKESPIQFIEPTEDELNDY